MNSSQLSISRFEVEFLTPTPMTYLSFSLSFETSGEKSLSPESDDEGVDVLLRVGRGPSRRRPSDVGADSCPSSALRDVDQLDGRLVELALVVGVARPSRQ